MAWHIALFWVDFIRMTNSRRVLGMWRAQRGPGPWSIFLTHPDGMLEVWAVSSAEGAQLFGKVVPFQKSEVAHAS